MMIASSVQVIELSPLVVFKFGDDILSIKTSNNVRCIGSLCGGIRINFAALDNLYKIIHVFPELTLQTDSPGHQTIEVFPYSATQF